MNRVFAVPDLALALLALLATAIGAFVIFDAGYARSILTGGGVLPREFATQAASAVVALVLGWGCMRVPLEAWRRAAGWVMLLAAMLVFLVAVPGVHKTMNGATRWISLGPINIQPSEFAKVAAIVFLAAAFAGRRAWKKRAKPCRGFPQWLDLVAVPKLARAMPLLIVLIVAAKVEREPDLGTAAVILAIAFAMVFLGGVTAKSMLALTALLGVGVAFLCMQEPYRLERIVAHGQRWSADHFDDMGYQTTQSEAAMASGGFWGVGIGSGRAKHMLPAATTDFVTATVGEEFGLVGSWAVLALIGAICFRLFQLARRAKSRFGGLVLAGTASWLGIQSCVNIMMANGTLPPIGIPLPFLSSGGSSLVALWICIGICQSAVAERAPEEELVEDRSYGWRHRRTRLSRA